MKRIALFLFLILASVACFAQTQIDPTYQIQWNLLSGSGAPSITCTHNGNYTVYPYGAQWGQSYQDTTNNVEYKCTTSGWVKNLPTTGGTLTGPLNGTSASFSGTVAAGTGTYNQQAPAYVTGNTASLWFNGTITDSGSTPFLAHSIQSNQTLNGGTAPGDAFASVDSIDILNLNGLAWNHYHSFQSRPQLYGSGSIGEIAGLTFAPTLNGTATMPLYGVHIANCVGTGCVNVSEQVGLYIDSLVSASGGNYAIYSVGTEPSVFMGGLQLANNTRLNLDGNGTLSTVGDASAKSLAATGSPTSYPAGQSVTIDSTSIRSQSAPGVPATLSINPGGGTVVVGASLIAGASIFSNTSFAINPTGYYEDWLTGSGLYYNDWNYNPFLNTVRNTGFAAYKTYNPTNGNFDTFIFPTSITGGSSAGTPVDVETMTSTSLTLRVPLSAPSLAINGGTPITSQSSANSQIVTCPPGGTSTQYCGADGAWHTPAATGPTSVVAGTGLNGGGSSGAVTVNLNTALPNGETATTQAVNDATTDVATDQFVQQQLNNSLASPGTLLASYFPYLDGTGTTLHDQSGNGRDCTFAGGTIPTWNTGKNGIIIQPIPSTSYLSCPAAAMSGAATIQIFYAPNFPPINDGNETFPTYLIGDSNTRGIGYSAPIRYGQIGVLSTSNSMAESMDRLTGNSDFAVVCSTPATLYSNGSLATGAFVSGNCPTFNGAGAVDIGTVAGNGSFNWSGTIYAVLFYSNALTAAQVYQNHQYVTGALAQHGVAAFTIPQAPYFLMYEGDSRVLNTGGLAQMTTSRSYYISQVEPGREQFWNVGIGGETLGTIAGATHLANVEYAIMPSFPSQSKTLFVDAATNDIVNTGGSSAATIYATLQGFCTAIHTNIKGTKVVYATSVSRIDMTSTREAVREAYNALVIAGAIAGTFNCDAVDDIANDPILATQTVPNNFNPSGAGSFNSTWFSDGIHETIAANLEMSTQESFAVKVAQGRADTCTVINKKIPYQVLVAANTVTPSLTQTITLAQLFPGWQVCSLSSNVKTAFAGTSISALGMTIGDSGSGGGATTYQSSQSLLSTGAVVSNPTFASANGIVQMNFTAVGANLTALTAGEVDIQIGLIVRP